MVFNLDAQVLFKPYSGYLGPCLPTKVLLIRAQGSRGVKRSHTRLGGSSAYKILSVVDAAH